MLVIPARAAGRGLGRRLLATAGRSAPGVLHRRGRKASAVFFCPGGPARIASCPRLVALAVPVACP